MTFRTSAAVAVFALLGLAAENRASAQPVAPGRPRSSPFGGLFGPAQPAVPNFGLGNQGGNPLMPMNPNNLAGGAVGGQGFAIGVGPNGALFPLVPFAGQPVVFNSLGRYYGGNYGHWYPNGVSGGVGVASNGGGGGGGGSFAFAAGGSFGGGQMGGRGGVNQAMGGLVVGGAAVRNLGGRR